MKNTEQLSYEFGLSRGITLAYQAAEVIKDIPTRLSLFRALDEAKETEDKKTVNLLENTVEGLSGHEQKSAIEQIQSETQIDNTEDIQLRNKDDFDRQVNQNWENYLNSR